MNFYDNPENVDKYIKMCDEYDGSQLYRVLDRHLLNGKSLLELGSGPGFDLAFLAGHYQVTGSDLSDEFLERLRKEFTDIRFLRLNAANLDIDEKYNCIYSNKVLHHLTESALESSLLKQSQLLLPNGIIAHSFWIGEESHEMEGLLFTYYRKEKLIELISQHFVVVETLSYAELEDGDSLFVIAQLPDKA